MDIFGEHWKNHAERIGQHWKAKISEDDLVLLPGDISWGLHLEEAKPDLEWIHSLPGTKVMLRGNHDYWWASLKKISEILPPSIHLIQNNAFCWRDICIGGSRLWDTAEYSLDESILYYESPKNNLKAKEPVSGDTTEQEKIYERELQRLETSLKAMNRNAKTRIVMTHYPPIGAKLQSSRASKLLEHYKVNICVFGHIHNVKHSQGPLFGDLNGVHYALVAGDYLQFDPLKIL